jgi:hypothetical protein
MSASRIGSQIRESEPYEVSRPLACRGEDALNHAHADAQLTSYLEHPEALAPQLSHTALSGDLDARPTDWAS